MMTYQFLSGRTAKIRWIFKQNFFPPKFVLLVIPPNDSSRTERVALESQTKSVEQALPSWTVPGIRAGQGLRLRLQKRIETCGRDVYVLIFKTAKNKLKHKIPAYPGSLGKLVLSIYSEQTTEQWGNLRFCMCGSYTLQLKYGVME